MRVAEVGGRTTAKRGQFRLRVADRCTASEATEDAETRAFTTRVVHGTQAERDPEVVGVGKAEPVRHHANHRRMRASDAYGLAECAGVAVEARLPEVVSDDGDRWCS